MRTDDIAFEQQITALTANLTDLPDSARASFEALIEETRQRHQSNRASIAAACEAATQLHTAEALHDAQVQGIATQLSAMKETLRLV